MTLSFELQSALTFPVPFLADAFAAGFQGYFVPIPSDPRSFELRVRTEHIDLGESVVAMRDGRALAIALVARRGARSRMAGLGVVPEARREGLGRTLTHRLIEDARARGDRELILECIETNHAALALYQRAGFEVTRRLIGWEGVPTPARSSASRSDAAGAEEVPLEAAFAALVRYGEPDLPWQLAPETVAGLTLPVRAYRLGEAYAVIADVGPELRALRAIVVPPSQRRRGMGRRLLGALAAQSPGCPLRVSAVVPETLGAEFFSALGFQRSTLNQRELVHHLR